jgi:plasmid stabilization system protein ParE
MAEISFHPEAEAEIQAATAWYLSRSQAAAVGLVEEFDRTLAMILQFPDTMDHCRESRAGH